MQIHQAQTKLENQRRFTMDEAREIAHVLRVANPLPTPDLRLDGNALGYKGSTLRTHVKQSRKLRTEEVQAERTREIANQYCGAHL